MYNVTVLGIFVADMTFFSERQPKIGETVIGSNFMLGPGGKGANQAISASRLGANVNFISRLGQDHFAEMAFTIFKRERINPLVTIDQNSYTGAASIIVNSKTRDNAVIVDPGAAKIISEAEINKYRREIQCSEVFLTQLEQPLEAAFAALDIAKKAEVTNILNPAPATTLDKSVLALCDYITPNETEAEILCGVKISNIDDAKIASTKLQEMGASNVIITLGELGATFLSTNGFFHYQKSFKLGPLAETTGAGDCFNGALAFCLAKKIPIHDALEFACIASGISVTKSGTANSMPNAQEVSNVLKQLKK